MKVKILTTKKIKIEEERNLNLVNILDEVFSNISFENIIEEAVQSNISDEDNTPENIELITEQIIKKLNNLLQDGIFDNP